MNRMCLLDDDDDDNAMQKMRQNDSVIKNRIVICIL